MRQQMIDLLTATVTKLMSGRFLFALSSSFVFVYMAVEGTLPDDDVKAFIGMAMTFYFTQSNKD